MRIYAVVVALFAVAFPLAAKAEILAVCGKPEALNATYRTAAALRTSETALTPSVGPVAPLALWRDAKGFDVLLNWGQQNQVSLRAEGADVLGNELGTQLIHLIVVRAGAHTLEHFLFTFDEDATGELIWNASGERVANDNEVASYETSCMQPK